MAGEAQPCVTPARLSLERATSTPSRTHAVRAPAMPGWYGGRVVPGPPPSVALSPGSPLTHSGHPSKVDTVKRDIMAESTLSKWKALCTHWRGRTSICVGSPSLYT